MDFDKMNGLVPAIIQDADTAKAVSYTHLHFFDICNSYGELFSKRFVLYLLYILILRRLEK